MDVVSMKAVVPSMCMSVCMCVSERERKNMWAQTVC